MPALQRGVCTAKARTAGCLKVLQLQRCTPTPTHGGVLQACGVAVSVDHVCVHLHVQFFDYGENLFCGKGLSLQGLAWGVTV